MSSMEDYAEGNGGLEELSLELDLGYPFLDSLKGGQVVTEVFELLPDVYFWVKNRDGGFEYGSGPFMRRYGVRDHEVLVGLSDVDLYPTGVAGRSQMEDEEVMRSGRGLTERFELVPNVVGGVEWRVVSRIPLFDKGGEIVGVAGVSRLAGLGEGVPGASDQRKVFAILGYLYENIEKDVTVVDLARHGGISVSTLERLFKAIVSSAPKRFILHAKMSVVCEHLLSGDESIKRIGELVGYDDHANFTRAFKKLMGESPSQYRKRFRKSNGRAEG